MERHNNSGEVDSETEDHQNDREGPQAAHRHDRIPQKDLCVAQERKRCKTERRKRRRGEMKCERCTTVNDSFMVANHKNYIQQGTKGHYTTLPRESLQIKHVNFLPR